MALYFTTSIQHPYPAQLSSRQISQQKHNAFITNERSDPRLRFERTIDSSIQQKYLHSNTEILTALG
jgi:hypothetical protein